MNIKKMSLWTSALMLTLVASCSSDDNDLVPVAFECNAMQTRCSATGVPQRCDAGHWVNAAACSANEVCDAGHCMNKAGCDEGKQRCDANGIPQKCVNGTWESQALCGSDSVCLEGNCIPTQSPDSPDCTDNATRCDENGIPQKCVSGKWENQSLCIGNLECRDGRCEPRVDTDCEENDTRCDNSGVPQKCINGKWENQALCSENQECRDGVCESKDNSECENDDTRCDKLGIPQKCINGKWENQALCGNGLVCKDGSCERTQDGSDCTDDDVRCDENGVPQKCVDGAWENQPQCEDKQACKDGNCVAAECTDNDKQCNASTPQLCVNGSWQDQKKCADGQLCASGMCVMKPVKPECNPGSLRCQNEFFQTCNDKGFWTDTTKCNSDQVCDDAQGCVSNCTVDKCKAAANYKGDLCIKQFDQSEECGCKTDEDCSKESQSGKYVCQNETCVVVCDDTKCGDGGNCLYPNDPKKITDCGCDPTNQIVCKDGYACNIKKGLFSSSYYCERDCSLIPENEYWGDVVNKKNECIAKGESDCSREGYFYNKNAKKCAKKDVEQMSLDLTDKTCEDILANTENLQVKACETFSHTLGRKGLRVYFTNADAVELNMKNNKLDSVKYYKTIEDSEIHTLVFTPYLKNIDVELGKEHYKQSNVTIGTPMSTAVGVDKTAKDPTATFSSSSIDYEHNNTVTFNKLVIDVL